MSGLDDILARSRAPGRFVERSRFTLAEDKAIEKLRQYSLPDPQTYILELIRCAVFAEARAIAIDASPERVTIAWLGGTPFTHDELENLFDHLLTRRSSEEFRQVTQLAVAVNAMLHLSAGSIQIESGDGKPGCGIRVDIDAKGEAVLGTPEDTLEGTYITVELQSTWLERFNPDLKATDELHLIEAHCRHCPVPIIVNGYAPFGWKGGRPWTTGTAFEHGPSWGSVERTESNAQFEMVIGGVIVERMSLPELGIRPKSKRKAAFSGVIGDDRLRRTADHSKIVRDRAFHGMLHSIQPICNTLMRAAHKRYKPPTLQPIPAEQPSVPTPATPRRPEATPLPEMIPQLGMRPPILRKSLLNAAFDRPAFWCSPGDAEAIGTAGGVHRLPYPVLLLSPGERRTLKQEAPQVTVWLLTSAADVDFYLRSMNRHRRQPNIQFEMEHAGICGKVQLRATLTGPRPGWALQTHATPFSVFFADEVLFSGTLPDIPVPRLDIQWSLATHADQDAFARAGSDWKDRLKSQAQQAIHRLLLEICTPAENNETEETRRTVLAHGLAFLAVPYFVTETDNTQQELYFHGVNADQAHTLRSSPLATTLAGDPLSLDTISTLQQTSSVVALSSERDLLRLAPLESRIGHGHLTGPEPSPPILAVATFGQFPSDWFPGDHTTPVTVATLSVNENLGDTSCPPGWMVVDLGMAPITAMQSKTPPEDADFSAGFAALLTTIMTELDHPPPHRTDRQLAMLKVAIARLSNALPLARNTPIFIVDQEPWSLARARESTSLQVVPRGGIGASSPDTLALSLEEFRIVRAHPSGRLLTRFDDPPETWSRPEHTDWLIRTPFEFGTHCGWLGLRFPVDLTGGIMLMSSTGLTPLEGARQKFPCHGVIEVDGPGASIPTQVLRLAEGALHQVLIDGIGNWTGAHATAAQTYADQWVDDAPSRTNGTRTAIKDPLSMPAQNRLNFPSMNLSLDTWLNELIQLITGDSQVTVETIFSHEEPVSRLSGGPGTTGVKTWKWLSENQIVIRLPGALQRIERDPSRQLQTRWMIALSLFRHWTQRTTPPTLRLELSAVRSELIARLLAHETR
jgi:hypothetical protein